MSRKHLSTLAIALVVVTGAIILLLPKEAGREQPSAVGGLLPGLEAAVNDVSRLELVTAGNQRAVTLTRGETGWTVEELAGYPADMNTVREVLADLARARVVEAKTDNPEYYARLGVEAVAAPEASGSRLDLSGADGGRWSVIVGNEAPNRGGRFLRVADKGTSVLADFEADVPTDPAGWTDSTIIDLMAGAVAEVRLEHADGETLTARKVSADESDFALQELPAGRELKSAWSVNSLGSALSTLELESVKPVDDVDWTGAINFRALRFDGLEITGELLRDEAAGGWLRLEATAPPPPADVEEASPDAVAGAVSDPAAASREINDRVGGWAYRIPEFKAQALDKRLPDLLKPPADAPPENP